MWPQELALAGCQDDHVSTFHHQAIASSAPPRTSAPAAAAPRHGLMAVMMPRARARARGCRRRARSTTRRSPRSPGPPSPRAPTITLRRRRCCAAPTASTTTWLRGWAARRPPPPPPLWPAPERTGARHRNPPRRRRRRAEALLAPFCGSSASIGCLLPSWSRCSGSGSTAALRPAGSASRPRRPNAAAFASSIEPI